MSRNNGRIGMGSKLPYEAHSIEELARVLRQVKRPLREPFIDRLESRKPRDERPFTLRLIYDNRIESLTLKEVRHGTNTHDAPTFVVEHEVQVANQVAEKT